MSEIISKAKSFKHLDNNSYLSPRDNPRRVDNLYRSKSTTHDFVIKYGTNTWFQPVNSEERLSEYVKNEHISQNKISSFDKITKHINEDIEKAKGITLNEDGEIEETNVSEFVWDLVRMFLTSYLRWVNAKHVVFDMPEITPLPDDSVDLMWYNSKGKLLINIGQDGKAYYYSDFHNKKNPMKGNVVIVGGSVDESLALRLKNIS